MHLYMKISFQKISEVRNKLQQVDLIEIGSDLDGNKGNSVLSQIEARHLLGHKIRVLAEDYVRQIYADPAMINRKMATSPKAVSRLIDYFGVVAKTLARNIEKPGLVNAAEARKLKALIVVFGK